MKARLSGDDPYFPEHPDDPPAPERLFIYVWGNAEGRARRLVERGAVSLLEEILKKDRKPGPAETAYIQAVLLLLAHIRPIEARDLLEPVVRSDEFRKERFTASGLDRLLVGAWAAQGQRADEDLARDLLSEKPYALDAFWVFAERGPESAVRALPALLKHFRDDPEYYALSELLADWVELLQGPKRSGVQVLTSHLKDAPARVRGIVAASLDTVGIEVPGIRSREAATRESRLIGEKLVAAYDGNAGTPAMNPHAGRPSAPSAWHAPYHYPPA
ncbi:MAG: hypothetical protein QGH70_06460 [Nitrospinota bacterium]|jgi:hypothetical protein|nr:hypothetical protein [Nitrospinota bacterium]MDP6483473.1 hypothetical protein [Nitrospinota bacterium]HJM43912.1 hypothetical protein [Nitrospinota bacterium]